MKSFVALSMAASAYASCCTFQLTASGGQSGTVGQLDDGQIRIGGGLPSSSFTICNGTIVDDSGYGCLLTPEVEQFQCDLNKSPQSGFSIASNGTFEYSGSSVFYACPASDTEWNIYTTPVIGQAKCVEISLEASGCGAAETCSSVPASTVTSVVTSISTIIKATTVTAPAVTVTVSACETSVPPVSLPSPISVSTPIQTYSTIISQPSNTVVIPPTSTPVTVETTYTQPSGTTTCSDSLTTVVTTYTQPSVSLSTGGTTFYTSTHTKPPHWSNHTTTAATSTTTTGASTCVSTALTGTYTAGNYQFPHLIVPVSSKSPDTQYGTQYFGTISSNVSTIFNFDIPASYSGHTCNLIFLLPHLFDLETSSYEFSGAGTVDFEKLSSVATTSTTYNNAPSVAADYGHFTLTEGSSTLISSFACPAGEAVAFEAKAVGDTYLYFFQDYNPSPLGMYITAC